MVITDKVVSCEPISNLHADPFFKNLLHAWQIIEWPEALNAIKQFNWFGDRDNPWCFKNLWKFTYKISHFLYSFW